MFFFRFIFMITNKCRNDFEFYYFLYLLPNFFMLLYTPTYSASQLGFRGIKNDFYNYGSFSEENYFWFVLRI